MAHLCKVTADWNTHGDIEDRKDEHSAEVEKLAEHIMVNVETSIVATLRESVNFDISSGLTRADIGDLCKTEEFNELFYAMASKLVK